VRISRLRMYSQAHVAVGNRSPLVSEYHFTEQPKSVKMAETYGVPEDYNWQRIKHFWFAATAEHLFYIEDVEVA